MQLPSLSYSNNHMKLLAFTTCLLRRSYENRSDGPHWCKSGCIHGPSHLQVSLKVPKKRSSDLRRRFQGLTRLGLCREFACWIYLGPWKHPCTTMIDCRGGRCSTLAGLYVLYARRCYMSYRNTLPSDSDNHVIFSDAGY